MTKNKFADSVAALVAAAESGNDLAFQDAVAEVVTALVDNGADPEEFRAIVGSCPKADIIDGRVVFEAAKAFPEEIIAVATPHLNLITRGFKEDAILKQEERITALKLALDSPSAREELRSYQLPCQLIFK